MSSTISGSMDQAIAFAKNNLADCASDLLELRKTGVLPEGKFKVLRAHLAPDDPQFAMSVAESIVVNEALTLAATVVVIPMVKLAGASS